MARNELEYSEEERVLVPPAYDCDHDQPCECTYEGLDGEWDWDSYMGFWHCKHCGDIQ